MKKTRLLFASLLTTSLTPIFVSASCAKDENYTPRSVIVTYGEGLTDDITIDEDGTLQFEAQVLPKRAKQNVVFESSNPSAAIIRNNKLIPQGIGTTNITAYPVGYPGLKGHGVNVTIANSEDITKIDESNVVNDGKLIAGLSGTFGIMLPNFKVDFGISEKAVSLDFFHSLTAKIEWISSESMEDDAAGIRDIKIDSFNDSTFTVVSSFKPKNVVPAGHVFKFKLTFYVDYDYESGTAASTIHGSREYSIRYDGDNDYAIDDSKVQKTIDFNNGDYQFAQITGYKAPFYFGEGTGLELKASTNDIQTIESFEIMNKVEADGYTTFDLGVHTYHMVKAIDDISNITISFSLNGIDVLVSTGYTILKTDYISVVNLHNLENYEGKSKLLVECTSNFDFLPNDMQIDVSMKDSQYPNPASYEITLVGNRVFNIEFYWDTLLPKFEQTAMNIRFILNGKHLVNCDDILNISNLDDENYIKFEGNQTIKIGYDYSVGKYFTRLSKFSYGPSVVPYDQEDNFEFKLTNQSGTEIATSFKIDNILGDMSYKNEFSLLMYWEQKPAIGSTFYLDISYLQEKKISGLQLSFVDPDPNNFYTVNTSSNIGSMEVLKNKKDETIEIGINIDLTKNKLIGLQFLTDGSVGPQTYTLFYSYEYNSDASSQYKILVHIQPKVEDEFGSFSILTCDTITLNAIFAKNDQSTITFSKEGTTINDLGTLKTFQTQNKVTIKPNTTYYIKAPLSNWTYLLWFIGEYEFADMFIFICGEDISSSENYMGISGQFLAFFNNCEITTNNFSSLGVNLAYVQPGYKELFDGSIRNGEFTFVWTPEIDSPVTIDLAIAMPTNT